MPGLTPLQQERLTKRSRPRHDSFRDVTLPPLPELPGMISASTSRYYYWLTHAGFLGVGDVVELGTWLGRSTVHLAAGLRDAGFPRHLVCFDGFEWRPGHTVKTELRLSAGDDFQPIFEEHVRPVYDGVRVRKTAFDAIAWDGGPVELLVVDGPKRRAEVVKTFESFAPSLIPGVSLLVMQDYLHYRAYPLAALVSVFGSALEVIHTVKGSGVVSFRVKAPLDVARLQMQDADPGRWTPEQARTRWETILSPLPERARAQLAPALALHLFDLGDRDGAVRAARASLANPLEAETWRRPWTPHAARRYRRLLSALDLEVSGPALRPARGAVLRQRLQNAWRDPRGASRRAWNLFLGR